ncbi:MAG: 1-acyl-sn-glycerol-3-phosphate acyltransferase [Ideonella sp.]|nr:1-acyl-sn-glycerol-3-phosphate acyltransferase [Ideonella sp.]
MALSPWLTERPFQTKGVGLARTVLKLAGWELVWTGLPSQQGVFLGYPHTSNWDFVIAVLLKWGSGMHANFWAKDSLFRVPVLGAWLRWLGGLPVDRRSANGMVGSMVDRFNAAKAQDHALWLAVTPEGTRSYVPYWKSGFYQVAVQAQVPVGLVVFDFKRKRVGVDHFLRLCGNPDIDLPLIAAYYADVQGKRPEKTGPVRFK